MWPALDSCVGLPTSVTRPRPLIRYKSRRGRGLNVILVPHTQSAQRDTRKKPAEPSVKIR
jgi:hypothetical protein